MITPEDIKNITNAQIEAQKEIFFTKSELDEKFYSKSEMDEKFSKLQTSVDNIAKGFKKDGEAITVIQGKAEKIEAWIDKAAPKIGVIYEH